MNNLEQLINDAKEVIAYEVLIDEEQVYLSSKGEDKLKEIITQAYNQGKEQENIEVGVLKARIDPEMKGWELQKDDGSVSYLKSEEEQSLHDSKLEERQRILGLIKQSCPVIKNIRKENDLIWVNIDIDWKIGDNLLILTNDIINQITNSK